MMKRSECKYDDNNTHDLPYILKMVKALKKMDMDEICNICDSYLGSYENGGNHGKN